MTKMQFCDVLIIIGTILLFILSLSLGVKLIRRISRNARIRTNDLLLLALIVIFAFAILTKEIGLETIIGSFLAGIILSQSYFKREIVEQITEFGEAFFVPIFFITMGMQFDIRAFTSLGIFAVVLIVAAIIGKIAGCGLASRLFKFNTRESVTVGVAMIPRAEVALIATSVASKYNLIGGRVTSAILMMIVVTTLVTPPVLEIFLKRIEGNQ